MSLSDRPAILNRINSKQFKFKYNSIERLKTFLTKNYKMCKHHLLINYYLILVFLNHFRFIYTVLLIKKIIYFISFLFFPFKFDINIYTKINKKRKKNKNLQINAKIHMCFKLLSLYFLMILIRIYLQYPFSKYSSSQRQNCIWKILK